MTTFAESAFLDAVDAFLTARASTAKVGVAEPVDGADLPAVVLSLDSVRRLGNGLGERSMVVTEGELQWTSTIVLANPVLPEDTSFALFTTARPRELILPHGGLLKTNLIVQVNGQPRTIVTGTPQSGEVRAERDIGLLVFGDDLAPSDTVVATYFLGQWERRVTQIAGVLRVDVRSTAIDELTTVSETVFAALAEATQPAIKGLRRISLTSLSSVGLPDPQRAGSRGRTALYAFDYEHEVNRPDSSGGVIRDVEINAELTTNLKKE